LTQRGRVVEHDPVTRALPALLPLAALLLGVRCNPELDPAEIELVLRTVQGNSTSPEAAAAVEARVAAVESGLRATRHALETHALAARMAERGLAGLSIAIVHQGRIEWAKAYGHARAGEGEALHFLTRFQAASISKPTSALAVLSLAEDGLVDLDADVNDALVSWQVPENQLTAQSAPTLRGILSHTAGFNVPGFVGYLAGAVPTLLQVLDGLPPASEPAIRVVSEPGSGYAYSGGGFTVLQQLLEDVTGQPFGEVVRERVLAPLGMARSGFDQPLPAQEAWAAQAHLAGFPLGVPAAVYPQLAAAGLWTTPMDLARLVIGFQAALAGEPGAIVSQATARQAVQLHWFGMGLGWFLDPFVAPVWFWHSGRNFGFTSLVLGRIAGGDGAVIMVNDLGGGADATIRELGHAIANAYGWWDLPEVQ
jgi:CubicO group peptidase (beta-lactamase class C family)